MSMEEVLKEYVNGIIDTRYNHDKNIIDEGRINDIVHEILANDRIWCEIDDIITNRIDEVAYSDDEWLQMYND